ncbi:MAG TPA: hypothetical protein VMV52_01195 [Candidatus Nanopelagicaceae bacterium]|nr:hypothetical protein [Candidatus Nanopelagicaceae bacterium]
MIGALGGVALLAGLWAGLLLLKLEIPSPRPDFKEVHGPLMVLGFFGTLIALERAVALGDRAGYLSPASAGLGGVALAVGLPILIGQLLLALGGLGLLALYIGASNRQASLHLGVMAVGALSWIVAVLAWIAGRDVALLVPFLAGFVVLTIAGERLELARVIRVSGAARIGFILAVGIFAFGSMLSLATVSLGVRIAGAGLIALAFWLARNDVARRTVRQSGLTRYMAVCLLAGYAWLATAGVLWLSFGALSDGRAFDAMLHALFLGFVMGMVFAHAPVIVPAVFRVAMPYRSRFYCHFYLLHASLLIRLVGGDLAGDRLCVQIGGVLNEVAVLAFLASSGASVYEARKSQYLLITKVKEPS